MREHDLIAEIFAPLAAHPGAFGLTDDAAMIEAPPGALVLTADALIAGVHFLDSDPAESIGHKALAVNLSDLAAKGARPFGYLMTLALKGAPDRIWLQDFAAGLGGLQSAAGITLLGGDTTATPGPTSISITAIGLTSPDGMVQRAGAASGDIICVTGTIGDAALGLGIGRDSQQAARWSVNDDGARYLLNRYRRPAPRYAAAEAVRRYATASIDISDGLVGDLDKLCAASGVGAIVEAARVPVSPAAERACQAHPGLISTLLTGGDDYELLATIGPDDVAAFIAALAAVEISATAVGQVAPASQDVIVVDAGGVPMRFARRAFEHFGGEAAS